MIVLNITVRIGLFLLLQYRTCVKEDHFLMYLSGFITGFKCVETGEKRMRENW